jgi:hypothetical protein
VFVLMFLMSQKPVFTFLNFFHVFFSVILFRLQKFLAKIPAEVSWKMWKFMWICVQVDLRKWMKFKEKASSAHVSRHGNHVWRNFMSRVEITNFSCREWFFFANWIQTKSEADFISFSRDIWWFILCYWSQIRENDCG